MIQTFLVPRLEQISTVQHISATVDQEFPNGLVECITGDIGNDKRTQLQHLIGKLNTANTWINLPPSNATPEVIHFLLRNSVGNLETLTTKMCRTISLRNSHATQEISS